jgi:hypothetical protein
LEIRHHIAEATVKSTKSGVFVLLIAFQRAKRTKHGLFVLLIARQKRPPKKASVFR